jgi:hypothetical protein
MFSIPPEIWGIVSVGFTIAASVPYLLSVIEGNTNPHMFSWIIWGTITLTAFIVQVTQGAGAGAWSTGVSSVFCIIILIASIKRGEKNITKSDWVTFILGMMAIPIWAMTQNADIAAVWVTIINGLGFYPTFRKCYDNPYKENTTLYAMSTLKHVTSIFALSSISIATVFYPFVLFFQNGFLVVLIYWRKHVLDKKVK